MAAWLPQMLAAMRGVAGDNLREGGIARFIALDVEWPLEP
jgi:hypothetical protein